MKVTFTRQARRDLAGIARYLAEHNPGRARSYVEELRTACLEIGEMPNGFERLGHAKLSDIRRRTFAPYLIFYRIEEGEISLVRIIHGARNYPRILNRRERPAD